MAEQGSILRDEEPQHSAHAEDAFAALSRAQHAAETIEREAACAGAPRRDERGPLDHAASDISFLCDVNLKVRIELGRTRMYVEDVLRLNAGSVVELDKAAGDPVDIFVNDRHIARGEVITVNDNFCVRVTEIIHSAAAQH